MNNHIVSPHRLVLPEHYHKLAVSRGFEWIGECADARTKTAWRCSLGHEWQSPYYSIKYGSGCPTCGNIRRREKLSFTAEHYHAIAAKWGITWLGVESPNTHELTRWRGHCGHEWNAPYSSIKRGFLCRLCGNEKSTFFRRKSPWDYADLGREHNFIWLGPVVKNTSQLTQWQCTCGNVWQATYNSIKQGCNCPKCSRLKVADSRRTKPEAYEALALSSGITWIGPYVKRSTTPTGWRCQNGHEWNARYGSIQSGTNCPHCQGMVNGAKVSQVQLSLAKLLKGEVNLKVGFYLVDVSLEVDDVKIAVEYDAFYWHREFQDMSMQEQKRDSYLIEQGWRIIHIRSNTLLPTIDELDCAITEILNDETAVEIILDDWVARK